MLMRVEALVLRVVNYQESSRIITLFTLELGKIAVIAKGARKPKSRFAGLFELGNHLEVHLFYKEGRGVHTLKEADFSSRFFNLRTDPDKYITLQRILELATQLIEDEEVNPEKWQFLKTMLTWLNKVEEHPANLFAYIQIRFANLQGIGLSLDFEMQEPDFIKGIDLETGSLTHQQQTSHFYPLPSPIIGFILGAITAKSTKVLHMPLTKDERKSLEATLDRYLQFHIEGLRPRKTDRIYKDLI